ncbi:hypothetical protein HZC34_01875 [Candidatus Saganbacteria bacterium]|nr:hypothetical protein [Candidatus Saganbacteria bacterium]
MDPIVFSTIKNEKSNASLKLDSSISSVRFIDSFKEIAKAQNIVITNGSGLKELDLLKNKEDFCAGIKWQEEEEAEEKILGFLKKIKAVLQRNKKEKEVRTNE